MATVLKILMSIDKKLQVLKSVTNTLHLRNGEEKKNLRKKQPNSNKMPNSLTASLVTTYLMTQTNKKK